MADLRICGQVPQRHGVKIITAWDRICKIKLKKPGLPWEAVRKTLAVSDGEALPNTLVPRKGS